MRGTWSCLFDYFAQIRKLQVSDNGVSFALKPSSSVSVSPNDCVELFEVVPEILEEKRKRKWWVCQLRVACCFWTEICGNFSTFSKVRLGCCNPRSKQLRRCKRIPERERERHRHTLLAMGIANCVVKMHLTCKTEHHDLNEKVKTYTRSMYM